MLHWVGVGRSRDDAVLVMACSYCSYVHHPGRYSVFTRMPLGGDNPKYAAMIRGRGHTDDCGVVILRLQR